MAGNNFVAYKSFQLCSKLYWLEVKSISLLNPSFILTQLDSFEWLCWDLSLKITAFILEVDIMCLSLKDHFFEFESDTICSLWCHFVNLVQMPQLYDAFFWFLTSSNLYTGTPRPERSTYSISLAPDFTSTVSQLHKKIWKFPSFGEYTTTFISCTLNCHTSIMISSSHMN
jgi:hypothetical protein